MISLTLLDLLLTHLQSARDVVLDATVVSENVHDYVHSLVYTR